MLDLNPKMISNPARIHFGYWFIRYHCLDSRVLFWFVFLCRCLFQSCDWFILFVEDPFPFSFIYYPLFPHSSFHPFLSFFKLHLRFPPLFWLVSFHVSPPHHPCWFVIGCGVLYGSVCHWPVLWHFTCSGWLSLVSGYGHCPPRPTSPWQAAQEHFLGRYCPPRVWPHILPPHPLQKTPGAVYFFSLAQWSSLQA